MTGQANETREHRLKRLKIRCWRRGTKEMDMLFGPFADHGLKDLDDAALDAFEALMEENDNDLYLWISGAEAHPPEHTDAIQTVCTFHKIG
ncbi:MAG: succinate dehydrogenase assembly factor 2 [Paracoccaceae bacterium]